MKKTLINTLYAALFLAVLYFLGREFFRNFDSIRSYEFHFNITLLALASAAYGACFLLFSFGWYLLLRYFKTPLSFYAAFLGFCITQPAKYIPGKIWIAVMRTKFCRPRAIPNSITVLSTGTEAVMEIFAGAYVSLVAILQTDMLGKFSASATITISILGLIFLIPKVFYAIIGIYLKITKQTPIEHGSRVPFTKLLLLQCVYVAGVFMIGLAQALFLQAFAPVPPSYLPFLVSIGAFSYIASIIAIFAPSGLGVREGIWYLALITITVPNVALIYAFASRVWTIILEALLVFICLPLLFFSAKPAPSPLTMPARRRS